jgi:hypothetical protein
MPRNKKDACPSIDIAGKKFSVNGYGRYPKGDAYAYNNRNVLRVPYHVYLEQGYSYIKAEPSGQRSEDYAPYKDQSWNFTLQHSDGACCEIEREWSLTKGPIDLFQLLYSFAGTALPPTPKNRNSKFNAYKKSHGKDVIQIDTGKAVDICELLWKRTHEDERPEFFRELDKGRVLGYGLYDSILLITLQEGDFKQIFHDNGYLPISVIYDKETSSHAILFQNDDNNNTVEMFGTARFVPAPSTIIKEFKGEVQTRMLKAEEVERAKVQKPEPLTHKPCESEKDSHRERTMPKKVEASAPADPKARYKTPPGLDVIRGEMRRWLYVYAFKLVLKDWEESKNDGLKRTQVALVKEAKANLIKLGIDENKGQDFFISEERAKTLHREAVDNGTLSGLPEMFPPEKRKS